MSQYNIMYYLRPRYSHTLPPNHRHPPLPFTKSLNTKITKRNMKFCFSTLVSYSQVQTQTQTPSHALPMQPHPLIPQSSHLIFNTKLCTSSALNGCPLSTTFSLSPSKSHMPTPRPYTSAATGHPRMNKAAGMTLCSVSSVRECG